MDYSSMLQAQEQAPFQGVGAAPVAEQPLPQSSPPAEQQQPGFLEKLRTNPALSQAALMMGARMMMGPKPGQDALGVLGESMMIGNHTFTMGKQNEVENEQAAARTGSEVKRNEAVTRRTELQTAQDEAAFPGLLEKTKAEIARLEAAGQYEKARAIGEIYDNQPERLATMFGLKVDAAKANIAQSRAAAGASGAAANNSNAHAERVRDEMKDPSKHRAPSARGNGFTIEEIKAMYPEQANDKAFIAKKYQEFLLSKKGEDTDVLMKLTESDDKNVRKAATEELAKRYLPPAGGAKPAASPTMPAAASSAPAPIAIPKGAKPADLVKNQPYDLGAKGVGIWDGTNFIVGK